MSRKPLCIELFCGMFGWSAGWLDLGGRVVGFDIDHLPHHGPVPSGAELVLQDVLTLHGRQFKDASLILASPPCQRYSWMAMPFSRGKREAAWQRWQRTSPFSPGFTLNDLFDACFRIQREASEAAGHHIPMVVENVKGAQPWVGRANANYGSFYLWGDVRSVGGRIMAAHRVGFGAPGVKAYRAQKSNPDGTEHGTGSWFAIADSKNRGASKNNGGSWFNIGSPGQTETNRNPVHALAGRKVPMNFHEHEQTGKGRSFQSAAVESSGTKQPGHSGRAWFADHDVAGHLSSKSPARKAASAQIAKIPPELSAYIARSFYPDRLEART